MEGNNKPADSDVAHNQSTLKEGDQSQSSQAAAAGGSNVESNTMQQSAEDTNQQQSQQQQSTTVAQSSNSPASGTGLSSQQNENVGGSNNTGAAAATSSSSSTQQHNHQQPSTTSAPNAAGVAAATAAAVRAAPQGFQALPETPAVEIKLFVGRVPRNADESVIRPVFEEFGVVSEIAIIKDRNTGMHKGSAFVRMASITQADAAIRALNNVKILDPQLGALQVRYATGEAEKLGMTAESAYPGQDQAKLFVGSLPRTITEAEVRDIFATCGQIDEVFIMKDSTSGQGKGCAFVKFAYKEQALHAIKLLSGMQQLSGAPRPLEVRFAESKKTIAAAAVGQPGGAAFGVSPAGMAALGGGNVAAGMNRPVNAMTAQGMIPTATTGAMAGQMYSQGGAAAATTPMMANHNPRTAGPWKEYFTDEGRPYYHNETTQQTQWERPAEFDRQDVAGPPGANIFVFHVPNDWTQQDLITNFSHFGPILSARIATDKTTGRNKGYAFVSYANIQSAAQAVQQMNGFMAGTKRLKVSIKQNEEMYVQHLLGGGMANPGAGVMQQGSMLASAGNAQPAAAMQANPLAYRGLAYGGVSMDAADPSQMGAAPGAAAAGQQMNASGAYGAGSQSAAVQSRYAAGPPTALHPATHRMLPAFYLA